MFTGIPICDMFGSHCFDKVISDEKFYKQCQDDCLEDCEGSVMTGVEFLMGLEEIQYIFVS